MIINFRVLAPQASCDKAKVIFYTDKTPYTVPYHMPALFTNRVADPGTPLNVPANGLKSDLNT